MKNTTLSMLTMVSMSLLVTACGSNGGSSYSLLSTGQSFKQASVNNNVDLLWIIDNSASMQPLQQNMTSNFNSFMNTFESKGYNFHLAVTTTDAYRALSQYQNSATLARFRDGVGSTHTGIYDILPSTMNLTATFVTNASQGASGSGDENAFLSMKASLDSTMNAGFVRDNSFLAVIILSDEDDFSDPTRPEYSWLSQGGVPDHSYSNSHLQPVSTYENYLDTLTTSTGSTRRYSVSAITVMDSACQQSHVAQSASSIVGQRYIQMVNDTNGALGSVCDNSYATSLSAIQERIIEQSTQFYLTGSPQVSSISVVVNGATIPGDATNGWTYNSSANSIVFHGAAIPTASANIVVNFAPTSLSI